MSDSIFGFPVIKLDGLDFSGLWPTTVRQQTPEEKAAYERQRRQRELESLQQWNKEAAEKRRKWRTKPSMVRQGV